MSDIKIPFKRGPDGISAEEETDVHRSVREQVSNALIHVDYFGRQGIVIEKCFRQLSFANPGSFLISKEDARVATFGIGVYPQWAKRRNGRDASSLMCKCANVQTVKPSFQCQ